MPRTKFAAEGLYSEVFSRSLWRLSDGVLLSHETYPPTPGWGGSWYKQRDTVNTINFRTHRPEALPHNPFTYLERDLRYGSGTAHVYGYDTNTHQLDVGAGIFPFTTDATGLTDSIKSSIDDQALNKSLTDLKAQKVNLGIVLAERKKTGTLILSTATRIGNSVRALKKGNIQGALRALGYASSKDAPKAGLSRGLANDWLALQFGWKPLLHDVYNAAEDLARISQEPRRFKVTSSKTFRFAKSNSPGQWYNVPYQRREFGRYTRKYTYVFSYSNQVLSDLSRFGVTNPAAVAWELLPWSFVADWFLNIGDYIDTWDATLGFTFEQGSTTKFEKWRVEARCNGTAKAPGNYTCVVKAFGKKDYVRCDRIPLASFPLPRLPSFDPRITFNRGVSTLALLRQRLKW